MSTAIENTAAVSNVAEANASGYLQTLMVSDVVEVQGLNKRLDMGELQELADSLKANGQLQPIIVTARDDGKFELVAGHRRVEALKLAGINTVEAIVKKLTNVQTVIANGLENLSRKDLTPVEEAETMLAIAKALGTKSKLASAREVGRYIGKNNVTVTARLKLAQASDLLKSAVRTGKLDLKRADKLIADKQDNAEAIAKAVSEAATAMVVSSIKRADTIANGGKVTQPVQPTPVNSLTDEDEDESEYEAIKPAVTAQQDSAPVVNTAPTVEDLPKAKVKPTTEPTVTVIPPKEAAPIKAASKPSLQPIKFVVTDTARALLECVNAELKHTDPTSERYAFLQGVQFGYQVMVGIDTDPDIPEEWEAGL